MKHMSNSEFGKFVMDVAKSSGPFRPHASYDPDGDCIEFLTKPDSFYAERIDDLVTVYYSHNSNEIIGSLIKGVSSLQKNLLRKCPGFQIEIRDGRVRLAHLFRAHLWSRPAQPGDVISLTYEKLIECAEKSDLETEITL
jgi:hypothetical protein